MKKKILILLLISLFTFPCFSEEAIFLSDDINIKYENSVWDELLDDSINVVTVGTVYNQGYISLYNSDILGDYEFIYLSEDGRNLLTKMIDKYLDWEELAISKRVTISKNIPDLKIPVFAYYTSFDEPHIVKNLTLTASFHSISPKEHYLILETDEKQTSDNDYIKYSMDPWYFSHDSAIILKNSISNENITKKIDEYNKQVELENEFV